MYSHEFQKYLSEKTGIDIAIIEDLFQQKQNPFDVALTLIEAYCVDEKKLGKIWGDYLGFAYVDPNVSLVNKDYTSQLGKEFILENKVLPLYKLGRAVTICTPDPQNPFIQDKLEKKLGELVSMVFCFPFDIEIYARFNNVV